VTEIDLEDKKLTVPLSEIGGEETAGPDASRGTLARIYNDFPVGISIFRKVNGKLHSLHEVAPGSTSIDFWTTDELFLASNSGSTKRAEFDSKGRITFWYRVNVYLPAGTSNYSRLFTRDSSATDGGGLEHAGDGARGR